jgi:hypothetical protein
MPEHVLSPADFEFNEDGELEVRGEQLRAVQAQASAKEASESSPLHIPAFRALKLD